ncbi:hypothetical protein LCGC14_1932280 [marine sediment metagenome]|uniref:Uncharacterized protein n=1 Tax=marine sediment metagenome TaxID=412755 RepID=A0A0F9FN74_9ZZZZ
MKTPPRLHTKKKTQRPRCIKTMISIPHDLKCQMANVDEYVNWSAVACQAFQAKLAEIKEAIT